MRLEPRSGGPLRLLILYETLYPEHAGGIETRNHELARALAGRGHVVTLAGFGLPAPASAAVDGEAGRVERRLLGDPRTLYDQDGRRRHRRALGFALRAPAALSAPDEVYIHPADLPAVTLVWRDGDAALTLTEIGVGEFANKLVYQGGVEATTVNGRPAYWLPGPHVLQLLEGWESNGPLIASNVLIWARDGITYRLEGDLTLDEAVALAESLGLLAEE